MPTPYDTGGVAQTLDELERKLRELERQLTFEGPAAVPSAPTVAGPAGLGADVGASPSAPQPQPETVPASLEPPQSPPPAREQLGSLAGQLDELERFRDQLQRTARELEDEYARLVARAEPAAGNLTQPAVQPAPAAIAGGSRGTAGRRHPAAQPGDATGVYSGTVVLDVGAFADIAALGSFEQALETVRGVQDVYLSGFEGRRATVEIDLAEPLALVDELRAALPAPFTVRAATPERLTVDLGPPDPTR